LFVPTELTEFRLFRGTENSRYSVPNHSTEEKNAQNSVRGTKTEANSWNSVLNHFLWKRKQLGISFCGTKIDENFRNVVPKHFAEEKTLSFCLLEQGTFVLKCFLRCSSQKCQK
jgi:hypothetical protein